MKDFMTKQSHSDSDEFHIEIKKNVAEEVEYNEVVVAPKAKKKKLTTAYNSDDFDVEKQKTQKETTFENDTDDAISEIVSKLDKIVSYDDTDSYNQKIVFYAVLFAAWLDLVCILYFLSLNNYLQILILELDFASFWARN